jgi:hypothetical protein
MKIGENNIEKEEKNTNFTFKQNIQINPKDLIRLPKNTLTIGLLKQKKTGFFCCSSIELEPYAILEFKFDEFKKKSVIDTDLNFLDINKKILDVKIHIHAEIHAPIEQKEYETTKERLEQELDKIIKADLDILIPDYSYDKILKEKKNENYTNVNELIQDYLNILIEFKMDMTDTILNKKDFEMFIKNDLIKTNEIIDYIKKNENEIIVNDDYEEDEINNEGDNDINNIKTELENAEKEKLEIIKNYSLLLEKRDKILRNSLKYMSYGKHSIRSYSSKLVTINLGEEKSCELSKEEKEEERCNCNLNSFKNCIVF